MFSGNNLRVYCNANIEIRREKYNYSPGNCVNTYFTLYKQEIHIFKTGLN